MALTLLAACDRWPLENPLDCDPACPHGVPCVQQQCLNPDSGVAQCEVGYEGDGCNACVAGYARDLKGDCVYQLPKGCTSTRSWLIHGDLPPLKRTGSGAFKIVGSTTEPVVVDSTTGLQWRRCVEGLVWTNGACTGTKKSASIKSAQRMPDTFCKESYAGYTDWRVPELDELESLVDYSGISPTIDLAAFPGFPAGYLWSRTVRAHRWMGLHEAKVSFLYGTVVDQIIDVHVPGYFLCVRGETVPLTRRFQLDAKDGSAVKDRWTGLSWRRCVEGMKWNGQTCVTAKAVSVDWGRAMSICSAPWRLPSVRELGSLRDYCVVHGAPLIDAAAFPDTPKQVHWTSTKTVGVASQALCANFEYVYVSSLDVADSRSKVRCVRSGSP